MRQPLVSFVVALILKGQVGAVIDGLRRRVYSDQWAFALRHDLAVPFEPSSAKIPLAVRPLRDGVDREKVEKMGACWVITFVAR